ncbi:hypothetical protein BY996DRAFT_6543481 [Phakopsora pachyrhizi]|nr:hypothetical protein BY996DRAFT_6543481 [Phakopsora pachyrhizi]
METLNRLIPIYVTLTLELGALKRFPEFKKRVDWFTENRPEFPLLQMRFNAELFISLLKILTAEELAIEGLISWTKIHSFTNSSTLIVGKA